MPVMAHFIESLTQEKTKIIQMGLMKDPKSHALTMHDGKGSSRQNEKQNEREGRRNKTRGRDIPNLLKILQVPKTLQILRRRGREIITLTAIN
jgi:hypothetical protein